MEEKKFVNIRKEEYNLKLFIKRTFGKGKISQVRIEYTPVGEKIIISTHKPGMIIGKRGEKIAKLTEVLKKKFKMENPHVDIEEIKKPNLNSQIIADEIALMLERFGPLRYKSVAYRMIQRIEMAGALGAEIRLGGKLPSDRARRAKFLFGYLKRTGESSNAVDYAEATALTKKGIVGIKVSILPPDVHVHDRFEVDEDFINAIKRNVAFTEDDSKKIKKKGSKK